MTPKIVGALLVRDEAAPDRYLKRVLENVRSFCDDIVVCDDGSTDDTPKVCEAAGAKVFRRDSKTGWWGTSEAPARKELWERAAEAAGEDGWLYIADADHELQGISPTEFRALTRSTFATCYSFPLWDCWQSDKLHRIDGYWQAWAHPRPWLFRALPVLGWHPVWASRGIHVGHFPANFPVVAGLVPSGAGINHLGYIQLKHRLSKMEKYLALA